MNATSDPKLREVLDGGLPGVVQRYGAKQRIRRAVAQRISGPPGVRFRVLGFAVAVASLLGIVAGVLATRDAAVATRRKEPVRAGASAMLTLRTARVLVENGAELVVERDDETGAELRLTSGTVLIHVRKGSGRPFVVRAGALRAEVTGTIFGVALGARGAAVEVVEGSVNVADAAGVQRIRPGESWPPGARLFAAHGEELERLRLALPPASPATPSVPSPHPGELPLPPAAIASGSDGTARGVPSVRPATKVAAPRSSSPPGDGSYRLARELERSGKIDEAFAAYQMLASASGDHSEDASFALARLEGHRGRYAAALVAVERYRARFGAGRYARDADVIALNAELALGHESAALAAADAFLARFSEDARAWRFRLVRAENRAKRGYCNGARADLAFVPESDARRAVERRCPAAATD